MFCKNCGKEMPDDAVMCVGCGKLIDGAEKLLNASQASESAAPVKKAVKAAKSWIFSMVAFILYFSVQLLATIIPVTIAQVILYGLFMAPILVMSILGVVASMKDYAKKEQRTFMLVMLFLSILFLVKALFCIIVFAVGGSILGGLL